MVSVVLHLCFLLNAFHVKHNVQGDVIEAMTIFLGYCDVFVGFQSMTFNCSRYTFGLATEYISTYISCLLNATAFVDLI
jgi:uncharacterized membrane protein